MNKLLGVIVIRVGKKGLLYWAYVPATVKVRGDFLSFDVDGFDGPSPYVVCLHLLHSGSIPVYLVQCLPCMYCNAILVSFLLTAPLCSLSLFSSILPVSPMYAQLHSTQGTWCTTPFFFHTGCSSFVCTRA